MGAERAVGNAGMGAAAATTSGLAVQNSGKIAQGGGNNLGKWLGAAAGAAALAQVASGFFQKKAADDQSQVIMTEAELTERQGAIAIQEAQREALMKQREGRSFASMQAHKYNASGVTLEGTPMLVLEDTRRKTQEEVDAILQRGQSMADLYKLQGKSARQKAAAVKTSGRNSLLGSFAGAALGALGTYILGRKIGLFSQNGTTPKAPSPTPPSAPIPSPLPEYGDIIR